MGAIAVDQGLPGAAVLTDNGLDQGQVCHSLVLGCRRPSLPDLQHCLSSPGVFGLEVSRQNTRLVAGPRRPTLRRDPARRHAACRAHCTCTRSRASAMVGEECRCKAAVTSSVVKILDTNLSVSWQCNAMPTSDTVGYAEWP